MTARERLAEANAALRRATDEGRGVMEALDEVRAAALAVAREDAAARRAAQGPESWRPPSAPHVVGTWTPRSLDDKGFPIPQRVECRCERCGQTWGTLCGSGLVRAHVQRFALGHLHADPMARPPMAPPSGPRVA